MDNHLIGLFGATSTVGECLLPLLLETPSQVTAFSRRHPEHSARVTWRQIPAHPELLLPEEGYITCWIFLAPIWLVPEYFDFLLRHGARRIVALSSTSRFTKENSFDQGEQVVAQLLTDGETRLQNWAIANGIDWVILRPTLIYGRGRDKNITEISSIIRRFGFFPLFGKATGLRQPVHAQDVASACLAAMVTSDAANRAYNISGGEILTYREMIQRIFIALGRRPRLLAIPLSVFRLAIAGMHLLPRYKHWTTAMAERMNRDLVFDHSDATQDFGFNPRPFSLSAEDMPK